MIQLLPQLKILLAYQLVDFRKGLDGLIGNAAIISTLKSMTELFSPFAIVAARLSKS